MRRIASYYQRDGRIISIDDTLALMIIAVLIAISPATGMHELSFITGLIVGMLVIPIFFHRFSEPLPEDRAPESSSPPGKVMPRSMRTKRLPAAKSC
jgi:hypothetical protein